MDPGEQQLLSDIERYGWHILLIPEDEVGPAFAYSIGIYKTLGQPEIVVFGLPLDTMRAVINLIGELARSGAPIRDLETSPDVLEGVDVRFRPFAKKHYHEYLGYARWFYNGDNFPTVQCVWPDKKGNYPWDEAAPQWLRERQPLLAD